MTKKNVTRKLKIWLAIGAIAALSVAVLYGFRATIAGTLLALVFQVSPVDNFKYEFDTPIEHITELSGGGATWMDHHDTYLRFQLERLAHLKEMETFQKADNTVAPIDFFKQTFPHDTSSLEDSAHLVVYSKEVTPGKMRKCLVYNSRTGVHFFRVWK